MDTRYCFSQVDLCGCVYQLVSRPILHIGGNVQTLLVDENGLFEVKFSADEHGGYHISQSPLPLYSESGSRGQLQPYVWKNKSIGDALWDRFSFSILLITETALLQLTADNVVRMLAGRESKGGSQDGRGNKARMSPVCRTTDGQGFLYFLNEFGGEQRIRKVQLPSSMAGSWPRAASPGCSGAKSAAATDPTADIIVSTLPLHNLSGIRGIAFVDDRSGNKSLVYALDTAMYRVAIGQKGNLTGAAPVLLAGSEDDEDESEDDGDTQRDFDSISGVAVDSSGRLYVVDVYDDDENGNDVSESRDLCAVLKVTPDGQVTTLVANIKLEDACSVAILPNGYLAIAGHNKQLLFIDLKLSPVPLQPSAAPPAVQTPAARTLATDLGALLDRQPDDTADVTLLVGGRTFAAHRGILAARCDYFQQRLAPAGGFADATSQQPLSLPEADPDAFAVVIRYLYTGAVDIPGGLASGVAEVADRLLLPELCREAQSRVLSEVSVETVVGALLWADARGPAFSSLLSDLKAWYLEHQEEVLACAPASLKRLMVESPDIMLELYASGKRQRSLLAL